MKYFAALLLCAPLSALSCPDDQYGCSVALCVAAPGGPSSVTECKPCIDRLRKALKKGKGWPSCEGVSHGSQPYEHCADVYKTHTINVDGGALCGEPSKSGEFWLATTGGYALWPGKLKAKPLYEDISGADGTTRYWFSLGD